MNIFAYIKNPFGKFSAKYGRANRTSTGLGTSRKDRLLSREPTRLSNPEKVHSKSQRNRE